jgi:transcriptional regulator with XRE-family HTH domain
LGVNFGAQLRQERIRRGLSQSQLGGDAYSPSYISLLEIGRREPTPEVVRHLARALQRAPEAVRSWNQGLNSEEAAYLSAGLGARQAWDARDYREAAAQAHAAARHARSAGNRSGWWEAACLQAESLARLGHARQALRIVQDELLPHPLTADTAALAVRARQLLASLCLGLGAPGNAVGHAREAAGLAAALPPRDPFRTAALRTLVTALAETGLLEEAWQKCAELAQDAAAQEGQGAGEAEWAIGNVAFLRGDGEAGIRHHERAARLLSPANDLELWARFNLSSAAHRLAGGITEPETLDALERAEIAYSVVGANAVDQLELALLRAQWHHRAGQHAKALEHLRPLMAGSPLLGHRAAAEAALLHARALLAAHGVPASALEPLRQARDHFTAAGLPHRAREAADALVALDRGQEEGRGSHPTDPVRA